MKEFIKYIIAGVINTITGYSIFIIFLHALKCSPEIANAVGYIAALSLSYIINRYFVFLNAVIDIKTFKKFVFSFIVAFLFNQLVLFILYRKLFITVELVQIISMITYTIVFFILNKYYVYSK